MEPRLHDQIVKDASGDLLIPCIAHGDYVKVETLASDRLQAKENIIHRQKSLVKKLNEDKIFAEFILKQPGMDKFFVKIKNEYFGTLLFYELYFNDIDNIWLICNACNLQKSNQETLSWFEEQWLYGQEFLDFLAKEKIKENKGILTKTDNQQGLAETAIAWFWDRHANYVSRSKRLFENVVTPLKILNIDVDRIIGLNNPIRAERRKVSLEAKMGFTESIANIPGLGMPKSEDESDHTSSDEEQRMTPLKDKSGEEIPITLRTYLEVAKTTQKKIGSITKNLMKEEFAKMYEQKNYNRLLSKLSHIVLINGRLSGCLLSPR